MILDGKTNIETKQIYVILSHSLFINKYSDKSINISQNNNNNYFTYNIHSQQRWRDPKECQSSHKIIWQGL